MGQGGGGVYEIMINSLILILNKEEKAMTRGRGGRFWAKFRWRHFWTAPKGVPGGPKKWKKNFSTFFLESSETNFGIKISHFENFHSDPPRGPPRGSKILKKIFFQNFWPPGGPSRGVEVKIFKITDFYTKMRFRRFWATLKKKLEKKISKFHFFFGHPTLTWK